MLTENNWNIMEAENKKLKHKPSVKKVQDVLGCESKTPKDLLRKKKRIEFPSNIGTGVAFR